MIHTPRTDRMLPMNRIILLAALLLTGLQPLTAKAASCEAYFPFDGNLDDASGNGHHGLMFMEGYAPATPEFAPGKLGQALHVTSGKAMRAFLDLHYDFCPKVTITGWFKLASMAESGPQYLFSTGGGIGPGAYVSGGTLNIQATGNGMSQKGAVRSQDTWYFLAVAYDYEAGSYTLTWRNRPQQKDMGELSYGVENAFWVGTYNDRMTSTAQDLLIDDLRIHAGALSADEIRSLAVASSPALPDSTASPAINKPPLSGALAPKLPDALAAQSAACSTHQDCGAGMYCAWDDSCHPDAHAPKEALTFVPVQTGFEVLPAESTSSPEPDPAPTQPSGPYGKGNPSFTRVAGYVGGNQRRVDLGEEFLTRIRLHSPSGDGRACRLWANGQKLDLCNGVPEPAPSNITVELTGSVIGRLSVCKAGGLTGLQVWGDVIEADGSSRYEPAASKDELPACGEWGGVFDNYWSASMVCAPGQHGTGLVVHSNDVGSQEVIIGLQLICRSVGVR